MANTRQGRSASSDFRPPFSAGHVLEKAVCVHIFRNPFEAARALQARDNLGIAEGLALWEIYTRAALAASVDIPRTAISRDALLDRPSETLAGLASSLNAFGLKGLVPPDPKALEDIIAPERDMPRASEAETEAFLSPGQSRLWSALRAGHWPRTEEVGADIAPAARQILRDLEARDAADAELDAEIRELRKAKLRSDQALHAASRALSQVRRENAALVESTTWRATAPLRKAADRAKAISDDLRSLGSALGRVARKRTEPSAPDLRTIAIRIGCPRPEMKDRWGDYHFAVALAAALLRKGVPSRIGFAAEPNGRARPGDVNLVLRGRHRYMPEPGALNLMWLISHPERVTAEEMRRFDHVFIASQIWTDHVSREPGIRCQTLLQCTDSSRFRPGLDDPRLRSPALFVANSRNVLRSVVREAVEQDLRIDIFGEMWEGLAPAEWIKGETIENVDLPRHYASADVVLNDHWDTMRENGFISNRIFDVLATGAPLVTDRVAGLPGDIADACHFFGDGVTLTQAVAAARRDWPEPGTEPRFPSTRARAVAETVRRDHSFDARAGEILAVIEGMAG